MNNCKIRLVEERDIPILFEHLKEFLETPNASTTGNPLPLFEDSKKFLCPSIKSFISLKIQKNLS